MLFRYRPLVDLPAIGALSLVKNEMSDIELYFGQFNHLVRVEWHRILKIGTAATTLLGLAELGVGRLEQFLSVAGMSELPTGFLAFVLARALFSGFIFVGIVGRRRLAGVGGVFLGIGVKLLDPFGEAGVFLQEHLNGLQKFFSWGLAQIVEGDVRCRCKSIRFSQGASPGSDQQGGRSRRS